mmetsp:Transcript_35/g.94  ORF Transcript_35/g.94 Transcript_35/m.94 type:complete len:320 (-) Transcript_35:97-1056(-)
MNQSNSLPSTPNSTIRVVVLFGLTTSFAVDEVLNVFKDHACALLGFDLFHFRRHLVAEDPARVVQPTQHHDCVCFLGVDHALLERIRPAAFLSGAKSRAAVDPIGTERQGSSKLRSRADAAAAKVGNPQHLRSASLQHEIPDVFFAGMAGALEAVKADDVDPVPLRRERVSHCDALVDGDDARLLEGLDEWLGVGSGGFHDLHALLDDDLHVLRVRRRRPHRGQDGQVDAERLAGQPAHAPDPLPALLGRTSIVDAEDPQASRVADRGCELGGSDAGHSAQHDRVLHAQHFGDARPEDHPATCVCGVSASVCCAGERSQ